MKPYHRIIWKPTNIMLMAESALLNVEEKDRDRVFAMVQSKYIKSLFSKTFNATESRGQICIKRILGKKCGQTVAPDYFCECYPPGSDHCSIWNINGKPTIFVSQPYGLTGSYLHEIDMFALKHGLNYVIDARWSWHFPSRTIAVLWSKKTEGDLT